MSKEGDDDLITITNDLDNLDGTSAKTSQSPTTCGLAALQPGTATMLGSLAASGDQLDLLDDFVGPTAPQHHAAPIGGLVDLLGDEITPPPQPPASSQEPQPAQPPPTELPSQHAGPSPHGEVASPALETVSEAEAPEPPAGPQHDPPPSSFPPSPSAHSTPDLNPNPDPAPVPEAEPTTACEPPTETQSVLPDSQDSQDPPAALQVEPSEPDSRGPQPEHSGCSQSLPTSDHEQGEDDEGSANDSDGGAGGQGSDGDERLVDSDREVVEEEDAFGDFADFTTASHFMPGGGLGAPTLPPPASASAAAARAAGAGPSSATSPSAHRHAHLGSAFPMRPTHGALMGGGAQPHGASMSGAVSDHGSYGGDFSDFSHPSPPPSVARAGGGRKSVASIASVGSRAGGDDDLGDYGSVVGSSVWRAPSQMATSSYAAAAGADDDFGDFTSDITSTSDFAPSTQPPSAVAVSGPGSVHPDDDFGSFASHRSTADDDEDDFGNFNAAPPGGGAGPSGAGGSGAMQQGGSGAGGAAGPSGSGSGGAGPSAPGPSPREGGAPAGAHPYHSTQTVGPAGGAGDTAVEAALLQLPPAELRQAVARALQPLLPPGAPLAAPPQLLPAIPDEQLSAAWAQLRRHVVAQGAARGDGGVAAHTGIPWVPLQAVAPAGGAAAAADAAAGSSAPAVKYTRPLRWKGSDSERRLLASLGLSDLAAQARAAEPAEGGRAGSVRARSASAAGLRQFGLPAREGDAPRHTRADAAPSPLGGRDPPGLPVELGRS